LLCIIINIIHQISVACQVKVDTLGGTVSAEILVDHPQNTKETTFVRVDMGAPKILEENIAIQLENIQFVGSFISMGNPHLVTCVDDVKNFPVEVYGPQIEMHQSFPSRTNVEFIQIQGDSEIKMRVWERGAGETMSCGSGSCASVVAAITRGLINKERVTVHLLGGDLGIFWDRRNNKVFLEGPATTVFTGNIAITFDCSPTLQ